MMHSLLLLLISGLFSVYTNAHCPNLQACIDTARDSCGPEPKDSKFDKDTWDKKHTLMECAKEALVESGFDFNLNKEIDSENTCSKHTAFRACHLNKPWHSGKSRSHSHSASAEDEAIATSSDERIIEGKKDQLKLSLIEKEKIVRGDRTRRHPGRRGYHHHKGGFKDASIYRSFKGCRSELHGEQGDAEIPATGHKCFWSKMKGCFEEHKDEIETAAGCKYNDEPKTCNPQVAAAINLCKDVHQTI